MGKQDEALEENFTDEEESDDEDEEEGKCRGCLFSHFLTTDTIY